MDGFALTKEQTILLNLATRSAWVGEDAPVLDESATEGADWNVVFSKCHTQAIPLAAFRALAPYKARVPSDVYTKWEKLATRVVLSNLVVGKERRVLHALLGGKFDYVILKGAAAARYYPDPDLRVAGDVDFLVRDCDKVAVAELLKANGYAMSHGDHANHWVFLKGNAQLEMHFEIAGVPFGEAGKKVKAFVAPCVDTAKLVTTAEGKMPVPTDVMHAAVILLHMQHHMLGDGLGLRHVLDWVAFVNSTRSQDFWEELIKFLKDIGLYKFTSAITWLAVNHLGLTAPDWLNTEGKDVADDVLADVLESGNFGANDKDRSDAGMLVSEYGKGGTKHGAVYNMLHNLHGIVLRQYPIVKKVWILYPFLYAYKCVRYLLRVLAGKRPNPIKLLPKAQQRKEIYKKLRVFEAENEEN